MEDVRAKYNIPEKYTDDDNAVALVRAMRQVESNNKYDLLGDNGTSYGAYQYQEKTWREAAKQYLNDENADITNPVLQDYVTYKRVKDLKDQGYAPGEIASVWNSGRRDPNQAGSGYNERIGVSYDTPAHVQKVLNAFNDISGKMAQEKQSSYAMGAKLSQGTQVPQMREQMIAEGKPVSANPEKAEPTLPGQIVRDVVKLPMQFLASAAGLFSNKENEEKIKEGKFLEGTKLGNYLGNVYPVGYNEKNTEQPSIAASIGTGLEAASYLPIAGGAKAGVEAAKAGAKGLLGQAGKKALVSGVEGAVGGALQGAGSAMKESKPFGEVAKEAAIGTGTGALLGGALGGVAGVGGGILGAGKEAIKYKPIVEALATGKPNAQSSKLAKEILDKEVDRVSEALPLGIRQSQAEIQKKTGTNGIDIWKQHGLVPEQEGTKYNTQAMQEQLQPWINKSAETTEKFAKEETKLFNLDESVNSVLEYIDKSNISEGRKKELMAKLVSLVNENVQPIKADDSGRYIDAEDVVKLKRILYNEAGFADDLVTQGKAQKIIDSPYFSLAKSLTDNVDKNATLPEFKQANKTFSDYLSALHLAKKLNGQTARSSEGFTGKLLRRGLTTFAGGGMGNIPGALIGHLSGEAMDKFFTNPAFRMSFIKDALETGGRDIPLEGIRSNLDEAIKARGVTKLPKEKSTKKPLMEQFKYRKQPEAEFDGYIIKDGKVTPKD